MFFLKITDIGRRNVSVARHGKYAYIYSIPAIYTFYTYRIYVHSLSFARSLARARALSLTHSLTHSLARVCSFWVSLARSLARSIDHSRARSLSHSLVRALSGAMSSAGGRALEWCGQGCPSTRQWRRSKMVASTLSLYPKSRSLLTRN